MNTDAFCYGAPVPFDSREDVFYGPSLATGDATANQNVHNELAPAEIVSDHLNSTTCLYIYACSPPNSDGSEKLGPLSPIFGPDFFVLGLSKAQVPCRKVKGPV